MVGNDERFTYNVRGRKTMKKSAEKVINQAAQTVSNPKSKDRGYIHLKQADGSSWKIPFVDAKKALVLQCKEGDIEGAVCGDPTNCVMARIFKDNLGALCTEVRVGKRYVHVISGEGDRAFSTRFECHGTLVKAIHAFDTSKGLRGFKAGESYTLLPPSPKNKRNGRTDKGPWGKENGKGARNRLTARAPIPLTRSMFCFIPSCNRNEAEA